MVPLGVRGRLDGDRRVGAGRAGAAGFAARVRRTRSSRWGVPAGTARGVASAPGKESTRRRASSPVTRATVRAVEGRARGAARARRDRQARKTLERRIAALGDGTSRGGRTATAARRGAASPAPTCAGARASAARLLDLGRALGHESVVAAAELAAGRVALAAGDDDAAVGALRGRARGLRAARSAAGGGRARLGLARAVAGAGARRGRGTPCARRCSSGSGRCATPTRRGLCLRSLGGAGRSAPRLEGELTRREREVLALLGEGWRMPRSPPGS